eukprot:COSAG04_NODE_805_length_10154_cov_9.105122_11_plen_275_part_00
MPRSQHIGHSEWIRAEISIRRRFLPDGRTLFLPDGALSARCRQQGHGQPHAEPARKGQQQRQSHAVRPDRHAPNLPNKPFSFQSTKLRSKREVQNGQIRADPKQSKLQSKVVCFVPPLRSDPAPRQAAETCAQISKRAITYSFRATPFICSAGQAGKSWLKSWGLPVPLVARHHAPRRGAHLRSEIERLLGQVAEGSLTRPGLVAAAGLRQPRLRGHALRLRTAKNNQTLSAQQHFDQTSNVGPAPGRRRAPPRAAPAAPRAAAPPAAKTTNAA